MSTANPSGITAQTFLIQKSIDDFARSMRSSAVQTKQARTIMEIVRASNGMPRAPGYITWSPDVRRAQAEADNALQETADQLVKAELVRLDRLFSEASAAEFQRQLGEFKRQLRYLGPIASRTMREASVQTYTRYRIRRTEYPSSPTGMRVVGAKFDNPADRITEGDLEPGVVLFQTQISVSQREQRIFAGTRFRDGSRGVLTLEFHAGQDSVVVKDESLPLSQQYIFGTLRDCLRDFERRAGVALPNIQAFMAGVGVWEAHQLYSSSIENPWKLTPGSHYEVTGNSGVGRCFLANGDGTVTQIDTPDGQPIEPLRHWGEQEWLSLRHVDQEKSPQVQRQRA